MAQFQSQATTNAVQEKRLETLEAQIISLQKDRDSAMKWGLITLGTAVIGLVVWIFTTVGMVGHK